MRHCLTVALVTSLTIQVARSQEKDEVLPKQKAAAEANWKKMEFKNAPPMVETAHFLIYSMQPEVKTKALGAILDKIYATALKPLKYEKDDRPWPGKLAVYILQDRGEFVDFMRRAVKQSLSENDVGFSEVRGDLATLVIGAPKSGKVDSEDQAKVELSTFMLRRKMTAGTPPEWVAVGFARSTLHRALTKSKVTARAPAGVPLAYLWTENADPRVMSNYATYVIDYLAYGPMADAFANFVTALRPGEDDNPPNMKTVLESIKLDETSLEIYARRWLKPPVAKPPVKPKPQ